MSSVGSTIGGGYPDIGEDVFNGVFASTEEALKSKEVMEKIKARMKKLIEEQRAKSGENANNDGNGNGDNNNNGLDDIKIVYINANDLDISYPADPIKPEEENVGNAEEKRGGENADAYAGDNGHGNNNNNNYGGGDDEFDDDDENSDDEDIIKDEL